MGAAKKQETNEDKPWVSNYPPLAAWLKEVGARCLQQVPVGALRHPTGYIETWQVNGRVFIVEVRANRMGWNIYTAQPANSIPETLRDADERLGLDPEMRAAIAKARGEG